jgi:RHS repeat-associated protein
MGSQVITNYFTWGLDLSQSLEGAGGIGGLLAQASGTNVYAMLYDGNGNIGDVYRVSGLAPPTAVAHFEYDPFGSLTASTVSSGLHLSFRFSTKLFDSIWGLIWYEYRPYSPQLRIFLNRDPIGEEGGLNRYGFVFNNPINTVDPLGLYRWWGCDPPVGPYVYAGPWTLVELVRVSGGWGCKYKQKGQAAQTCYFEGGWVSWTRIDIKYRYDVCILDEVCTKCPAPPASPTSREFPFGDFCR